MMDACVSDILHHRRSRRQAIGEHLHSLPLAQPTRAEQELIETLAAILQAPPEASTLFALLEDTRASFCFVRAAAVRHYLEKAPHLDADEEAHFQRGIDAARLMLRSYVFCAGLDGIGPAIRYADDASAALHAATVLHRCLHYSGMLIFEHYRAKRELPQGIWAQHNSLFATASRLGLSTLPVCDRIFDESRMTHCQAAFVTPLLVELSRPYGRSPRDLNLVVQWAEHAAHEVGIHAIRPASSGPGYAIEFAEDAPLRPLNLIKDGRHGCQLETAALTARLREMLEQLDHGANPERLGLCPENIEDSRRLLAQLAALWSLETGLRKQPRTRRDSHAEVCAGFQTMHHFVLDSDPSAAYLGQLKRLDAQDLQQRPESWEIIDSGPAGFRLSCRTTASRLSNGQLIAVRPEGGANFLLGQVEWLKREQCGRLLAGITVFPGIPQAVGVRARPQIQGQKGLFSQAFLLKSGAGRAAEHSILLPLASPFRLDALEVLYDRHWEITLGEEIQRGRDFVQISFCMGGCK